MPKFIVTAPDGKSYEVTAPDGATQQDILSYVQANAGRVPPRETGLIPTLKRGAGQAISALGSAIQDIPGLEGAGRSAAEYGEELVTENPSAVPSYKDIDNLGEAVTYAGERVGEVIPQIALPLAAAGAATLAGASAPVVAGAGLLTGALGSFGQEYGDIREQQREAGIDEKGRAAAFGAGAAALDLLGVGRVIPGAGRILGDVVQTGLTGAAKTAGRLAVEEGVTEAAQTALERAGARQDLTSPEAIDQYIEAGLAGAVGGGGIGAGQSAIRSFSPQQETPDVTETPPPVGEPVDTDVSPPIDVPRAPVSDTGVAAPTRGAGVVLDIEGTRYTPDVTVDGDGQVVVDFGGERGVEVMSPEEWTGIQQTYGVPAEPTIAETPIPVSEPVVETPTIPVAEPVVTETPTTPVTEAPTPPPEIPLSDADVAPITPEQFAKAETATREIANIVSGKTMPQVARELAKSQNLPTLGPIMNRVAGVLESFERSGIQLNIAVQEKARERALPEINLGIRTRGQMVGRKWQPSLSVVVKGPNLANSGSSEAVLAHELIHAATMTSIDYKDKLPANSRVRKAVDGLEELSRQISNQMMVDGKFESSKYRKYRSDPNEILAWGLTDSDFQNYLKTIPTKTGNAFTDFVRYIGKLLGLADADQNALRRLIELSEDILPADVQGVADVTEGARGWAGMGGVAPDVQNAESGNIHQRAFREIVAAVERFRSERGAVPLYESQDDPDRKLARYLDAGAFEYVEDPEVRDYLMTRGIRDLETGEWLEPWRDGFRGGHVWQMRTAAGFAEDSREQQDAQTAGLTLPQETFWQRMERRFADRLNRLKLAETFAQYADRSRSAYEAARRMDAKAAARIEDFNRRYFKPIVKMAQDAKIDLKQLDWFLYARAAEARNVRLQQEGEARVIRKVEEETGLTYDANNPQPEFVAALAQAYQDGKITESGSGISTIDAQAMMTDFQSRDEWPVYERIGQMFDAMHRERMELAVRNGLVSQSTADYLRQAEPNYAPMKGRGSGAEQDLTIPDEEFDPLMGYGGTGIAISANEWRKAGGRASLPFSPFSYAKSDAITSLVRGERNVVGQLLMDFLARNPSNLWKIYSEANPPRDRQGRIISITNENPHYAVVKRGGKAFYLRIDDPLLMRAVKALDVQEMRPLLNAALFRIPAALTRALARSFTSWNPEFFIVNYARDIQSALLNIMSETDSPTGRANGRELVKNFAKYATDRNNLKAIAASEFETNRLNADPATMELYRQFKLDGGAVGWVSREDPKEIAAKVKQDFEDLQLAQQRFGTVRNPANRTQMLRYYYRQTGRTARAAISALENANAVFENGIRFAAYRAALDAGLSRDQAAMLAREATVDFNRRGEASAAINGLYAFFNAGVQGALRTGKALSNNPIKTGRFSRAQATVLGVMGMAAVLAAYNAAASGEDEDGKLFYDKIPDYEKERALIIMNPNDGQTYVKLPIPYGFGFFPALATRLADAVRTGDMEKVPLETLNSLLQNFSPIQFGQGSSLGPSLAKAATPTLLKPFTDLMLNENFMGKPIYNEPFDKNQSLASVSRFNTAEEYKTAAQFLNDISGGEGKVKGDINISAEGLEYLLEFGLGGISTIGKTVQRMAKEDEPLKAPVLRRFVGSPQASRNVGEYYERANDAQARSLEYRAKETPEEKRDFMRRNPVAMHPQVQAALARTRTELRKLNKVRKAIQQNRSMDDAEKKLRLEELNDRVDDVYVKFNTVYNRVEKREG